MDNDMVECLKGAVVDALTSCGDEQVPEVAALGVAVDALVELTDYVHGASEVCRLVGSALSDMDGRGGTQSVILHFADGEGGVEVQPPSLYSEKVDFIEGLAAHVNNSLTDEPALWHRSQEVAYKSLVDAMGDALPESVASALSYVGAYLAGEAIQHGYSEKEVGAARTRELMALVDTLPKRPRL